MIIFTHPPNISIILYVLYLNKLAATYICYMYIVSSLAQPHPSLTVRVW